MSICLLLAFVIGVGVGMLGGFRLAGPKVYATGLGSLQIDVTPARRGIVDIYIPLADWGIRVRAYRAPLNLNIEPRRVDREALVALAGGDSQLLAEAEKQVTRGSAPSPPGGR